MGVKTVAQDIICEKINNKVYFYAWLGQTLQKAMICR